MNLGTLYDLYSVDQVLTLEGKFSSEKEPEFKDLFLQSLKESEFLSQGSVSRIQGLSLDQLKDLVNTLDTRQVDVVLYFPIKIYKGDKVILKKYSKDYSDESLLKIIQESYPKHSLVYFGVLLDTEFKFSDVLKVLSPDQWFHVVLKE
jgi:hypothetical protein